MKIFKAIVFAFLVTQIDFTFAAFTFKATSTASTARTTATTPKVTTLSATNSTPMVTTTPKVTSLPATNSTPATTTTPVVTTVPPTTSTPVVTTTSATTTTKVVTTVPPTTSTPMVTTTPATTTTPVVTTVPPTTSIPMVTTTSATTTTPKVTTLPVTNSSQATTSVTKNMTSATATSMFGTNATTTTPAGSTLTCQCVTTGFCEITGGQSRNDGAGKIDLRIANFNSNTPVNNTGTVDPITTPASTGITQITTPPKTCANVTERCCTSSGYQCGLRYPPVIGSPKITNQIQTQYGAYPWQGIVFRNGLNITSGALIDQWHFLTTATYVQPYLKSPTSLKLRMGEWDLRNTSTDPFPYREYQVESIVVHPNYDAASSKNNIAILKLKKKVNLGEFPTIGTACLPSSPISTGIRCWASGWTYLQGNLTKQDIQRQVDLPLVDAATCQAGLRNTILGPKFVLDNSSFICAGGESGKDTCDGDAGVPLVCQVASQFYVTGLAVWGMGCGTKGIPGVYVNVQNYVPWIQATISAAQATIQVPTLTVSGSTSPSPPSTTIQRSTSANVSTTNPTTIKVTPKP